MVCCCFSGSLEVINHLNIYFFTLSVDWTLRVVSTQLIGPQGEEKNYIFGAHTSMAPTSAVCTGMIKKGIIKLQCASVLIFTAREDTTLNSQIKADILLYAHFQGLTMKCFTVHKARFAQLTVSVSPAPVFPVLNTSL